MLAWLFAITLAQAGQTGIASWYHEPQNVACPGMGKNGSNQFDPTAMTAAMRSTKCGTKVRVTNSGNGRSVVVTINDQGPFVSGRIIDLSRAAFAEIGHLEAGTIRVTLDILNQETP